MRRSVLLFPVLWALLGCEDTKIGQLKGSIEADEVVNFGQVPVGVQVSRSLTIRNPGPGPVVVRAIEPDEATFVTDHWEFSIDTARIVLNPTEEKTVDVFFRPFSVRDEISSQIVLRGDDGSSKTVLLRAQSVEDALLVIPHPVDFGDVLAGTTKTLSFDIKNISSTPLPLRSSRISGARPDVESTGLGTFDVLTTVDGQGSLNGGEPLAPGATLTLDARYTPDAFQPSRDQGRWLVAYCDDDRLCTQEIRFVARGVDSALQCAPGSLDLGILNPGESRDSSVLCTNISAGNVFVTGWSLSQGTPNEIRTTPSAARTLGPAESLAIIVTFAPSRATPFGVELLGVLSIQSESEDRRSLGSIDVALRASAGAPEITVAPDRLRYGRVALGTTSTKRLLVANTGFTPLVATISPDMAMTGVFSANPLSFALPAGTSTVVQVTFEPNAVRGFESELVVQSNDPNHPEVRVSLAGDGIDLPPCAYTLTPNPIAFGVVEAHRTDQRTALFQNVGSNDCLVNDVEIQDGSEEFTLVNGAETGVMIPAGTSHEFPISYTPTGSGTDTGFLTFYVSDPVNSNPRFAISGSGLATIEVTCPGPIVVPAGTPVDLEVVAQTQGTSVNGYQWRIVSAPPGGIGTPDQWSPDPPEMESVQFLPFIVGEYVLEARAADSAGNEAVCQFLVTAEGHGLRVTLTWDGPGDVDLHLLDTQVQPWFDAGSAEDCFYSNMTPVWDSRYLPGEGSNPALDFDNTSADGPENTRIDLPIIGQPYTVGVHNYSSAEGRVATVDIFCGGVTLPSGSFTSHPLQGTDGGDCSPNEFWKVALVVFSSPTACTITPIDVYGPSEDYCINY